jgi:DNA invertase Pin-like site-specific DNA recombinase
MQQKRRGKKMENHTYGYARVSTQDQDCKIQCEALRKAGCTVIREEKASGTSRDGRTELETLLSFIRKGDTLMVTRIDRLARSMKDLQDIVHELKGKGVTLKATEQPIDTGSAAGKAFLDMLGVFAEFETNLRKERQMEGIAKAKAEGVYKGGKARIDRDKLMELHKAGRNPTEIAKEMGINRVSVYRLMSEEERAAV